MSEMDMRYCESCKRKTLHVGLSTSHVLHFLISIVTMGMWIPMWLIIAIRNEFSYECTECKEEIVSDTVEDLWGDGSRPVSKDSLPYRMGKSLMRLKRRYVG